MIQAAPPNEQTTSLLSIPEEEEAISRRLAALRRGDAGIHQVLQDRYGLSLHDIRDLKGTLQCDPEDAKEELRRAWRRRQVIGG